LRLGIIGGTGLISVDAEAGFFSEDCSLVRYDTISVETEYGFAPLQCLTIETPNGVNECVFLQRHHSESGHGTPPHQINHHANMKALGQANLDLILSVCSVGSLDESFPPGKIAVAQQYIDLTGKATTFHELESTFTSVTVPFHPQWNQFVVDTLRQLQGFELTTPMQYTYWLTEGPQFETPADVNAIAKLGGQMVGMTMPREAKLAAELGIPYVAVCISSNWAAGRVPGNKFEPVDHEAVSAQANERLGPIWDLVKAILFKREP